MDTPQPTGGRRMDGPVRRVHHQTDSPNVTPPSEPAADLPTAETGSAPPPIISVNPLETPAVVDPTPGPIEPLPPRRGRKPRKSHKKRWIFGIIAALVLGVVGWFGFHAWLALHNIIQKHVGADVLNGGIDLSNLKEGGGRVNILVMGIGGDGHDGPNLTDTMIVWSIDPKTYDVAAISVPRDLYVKIPGYGYGKINSANPDGGAALAEQVVSNVLGITINYYAIVDFSGFKQAVDAVGGVDINVATALFDKQYPCDTGNNYCPYSQPAGNIHMNGTMALKYARCRHNDPGVGNCGNDYGRSARQQQVIAALKAKALSLGTLTNPAKLSSLIDAVGAHLKTDLDLADMKTLAQLSTKIDTSKIVNKVLDDEPDNYLVGGTNIIPAAGYIYVPKAGIYDYSDIHDFVKNIFVDRYIIAENAKVEVDNGSGVTGLAAKVSASLQQAHYNVLTPANAATTTTTVIYDYTNGKKPYTIKYLEQRFGVTAVKATPTPTPTVSGSPAASVSPTPASPEIRIILGSNYQASN